jgi:hypothetical protein
MTKPCISALSVRSRWKIIPADIARLDEAIILALKFDRPFGRLGTIAA